MFNYYTNCTNWPERDVDRQGGLRDLINDRVQITRQTFLKYVNREELKQLEQDLGYVCHKSRGLTMANDFHVEYFRSKHHGKIVYGFRWSGIEYVFKDEQDKDEPDQDEDNEPDILDLNDWLVLHKPHVYEAIKNISYATDFRKLALIAWREAGCPDISEDAPYTQ